MSLCINSTRQIKTHQVDSTPSPFLDASAAAWPVISLPRQIDVASAPSTTRPCVDRAPAVVRVLSAEVPRRFRVTELPLIGLKKNKTFRQTFFFNRFKSGVPSPVSGFSSMSILSFLSLTPIKIQTFRRLPKPFGNMNII